MIFCMIQAFVGNLCQVYLPRQNQFSLGINK